MTTNPNQLLEAFRAGRFTGPNGPLTPSAAVFTRRSLLLYTPGSVLKIRRPIVVDGVDQRTGVLRMAICERELWVGRRIAPEIYLGDASLALDDPDQPRLLNGSGVGEPVIAMRRLSDSDRADQRVAEALAPQASLLAPVMATLAAFHEAAPVHRTHAAWGDPDRVPARFAAAILALDPNAPNAPWTAAHYDAFAGETSRWLSANADVLAQRTIEGRLRDGHGDLRLEHIYLTDPVAIIDPAEGGLNERFIDTAQDVARLAMELDAAGWNAVGDAMMDAYAGYAQDGTLWRVLPLYKRLHALRRAYEDWSDAVSNADPAYREPALQRARFFVELARATPLPPRSAG